MHLRLFLSLLALLPAAAASAQQACTPRTTPTVGADDPAPTLFVHCIEEMKCGAVDKTGTWRIKPQFRDILIKDDFIVAPENDDWTKYAFLDQDGNRLGGGDYTISVEEALPVSDGLMPVITNDRMGYADRTGALVIPAEYDEAYGFSNGFALVVSGDRRRFIDKTGKEVLAVPAGVDDAIDFNGEFAIMSREGKYALLGKTGEIAFEPTFDSIYSDNGILIAQKDEGYGIIDTSGNWLADPDFAAIGPFSNGLAPAQQGELWGFIDTCGNWKIPAKYSFALGFEGGPARVQLNEKWGLIDEAGKEITPIDVKFIGDSVWRDGLMAFSPDEEKYGAIDTSGKVVVEPKYDGIDPVGGGVLQAYEGEEMKLLNLDGSEIKIAAP